jgi:hypothetical protein
METEKYIFQMEIVMKVNGIKALCMVKDSLFGKMDLVIKVYI